MHAPHHDTTSRGCHWGFGHSVIQVLRDTAINLRVLLLEEADTSCLLTLQEIAM